ncbi:MAG: glycosyltransferase family 39 protein [Planctomycetaceae bacterium]|nr:glycosyltransferase family 39 protein [Planctomycetaceae bacterium]
MDIPKTQTSRLAVLLPAVLCAGLTLCCILSRPPLPPDETRYLTVAWEMKERGDFLVPHLNGDTYAHKPPLLFWLMNLVWLVTGKSLLAARWIAPVAGILTVILTARLAKDLWPDRSADRKAPWILASTMLWMFFSPVTMFDTLLSLFTVSALMGMRRIARGDYVSGLVIAGCSIGLGILSKGPVILVHVLPTALLFPFWSRREGTRILPGLISIAGAIGIGAVIALSWALPAARYGGEAFGNELLFGQTAGRVLNSFAHRQPFWWYLPWLPLCAMPWTLTAGFRRGVVALRVSVDDGLRFVMCWGLGSLLILSFVSGKQIYYLMPAVPAWALAMSRWLDEHPMESLDVRVIGLSTTLLGTLPLAVHHIAPMSGTMVAGLIPDLWCLPLIVCGGTVFLLARLSSDGKVAGIAVAAISFIAIFVVSVQRTVWGGFDMQPLGEILRDRPEEIAWFGNYHGQLNIPSRRSRVEELITPEQLDEWLQKHTEAAVVIRAATLTGESRHQILKWTDSTGAVSSDHLTETLELASKDCDLPGEQRSPTCIHAQWIRRGLPVDLYLVCKFSQQK